MNNRFIGGIALIVLVGLVLGFWFGSQHAKEAPHPVSSSIPSQPVIPSTSSPGPLPNASVTNQLSPEEARKTSQAQVQSQNQFFQTLFQTPIVFYGKVVDSTGLPIPGATASISAADSMADDHSKYEKKTDEAGLFSISTHGMGLVINVSKDGYYKTDQSSGSFGYTKEGGSPNPHSDPNSPAIFVLRKMGEAERLIVTSGIIEIARDGTPRPISLTTGNANTVTNGDITVQAWVQDQGLPANSHQHYDWRCLISVPGGGLQPRTGGEFDFTAPENGYQPSATINMPASYPNWSNNQNREYFLKLANGDYARMSFTVGTGGYNSFEITSYLNPTPGHHNLEYDTNQQVNK